MPSYLFFFESELFPVSQNLDEFWFNSIQKDSIVANKINCSFLKNEKNELYQDIQKLLATQIPNCEVIEYGKMTLLVEHDYTVSFIIFISKEPIIEKVNGNGYLSPKFEELKKIAIKVRNFLSESKNILIVKRLVSNIFLPDRLKEEFDRTIKRDIEKEKSNIDGSLKTYYQNNVNYPFLIEFQTNFSLNHEERFNEMINDYYLKFFPFIKETGSLISYELSFCEINQYIFERFDKEKVANIISNSFLNYVFTLYLRTIDFMTYYRDRVDDLTEKVKTIPGRFLSELSEQLKELHKNVFEEYPILFINFIDKYILFGEDTEQPDLMNQIFFNRDLQLSGFKRSLQLLKEKIATSQAEIKNNLLYIQDRITSFKREELQEKLNSVENEKIFRETILIPILKDLGYDNIQDIHGPHEYGVDILFSNMNKFCLMEWNAIVAKIGDINSDEATKTSQSLEIIFNQIYKAKNTKHIEKNYEHVKISRVFVVTNGKINSYAEEVLLNKNPLIAGNIFFIDSDTFLNLY